MATAAKTLKMTITAMSSTNVKPFSPVSSFIMSSGAKNVSFESNHYYGPYGFVRTHVAGCEGLDKLRVKPAVVVFLKVSMSPPAGGRAPDQE